MTGNDLKIFSMFYVSEHDNLSRDQKLDLYEFIKEADSFSVMNFLVTGKPIYVPNRYRRNVVENFMSTQFGRILVEDSLPHIFSGSSYGKHSHQDTWRELPDKVIDTVTDLYKTGVHKLSHVLAGHDTFWEKVFHRGGYEAHENDEIMKLLNAGAMGIGIAAVTAFIGYTGYKVYQKYFSTAARICKDYPDKNACMSKVRVNAIEQTIKVLISRKPLCKHSADDAKCKVKVDKKIRKMQERINSLKKKYK